VIPGKGTLTALPNGDFTFTPDLNYNGVLPTITYTVSDGTVTNTATLKITVTPVNDAPTVIGESVSTPENTAITGNVLTNVGHSPSETQYISSKSAMSVNMSMDLPAGFYANNLTLVDTFEFGLDVFNNFKQASIMARVDNGFPFGTKITMVFLDTANKAVDSVAVDNLLMSSVTDANGRTVQRGISKFELPFNESRIATLNTNKVNKIKLVTTLATENQGGKVVRIYSDYDLKISLGIIGRVSIQ
jgi:hypothetical protein